MISHVDAESTFVHRGLSEVLLPCRPACYRRAGVTGTSIGPPDLSGTFEFNLQATIGVRWFLRDDLALTGEVRYLHMSCAGIHSPNLGANSVPIMVGLTWFFGK